jgi:hypothetical protein
MWELIENMYVAFERRVARLHSAASMGIAIGIAVLMYFTGFDRYTDAFLLTSFIYITYARRHFFLRDLKVAFLPLGFIGFFASLNLFMRHSVNKPGDPTETVADRVEGETQWEHFDATHNGTRPLDLYGQIRATMRDGTHLKVRRSRSYSAPGILIMQVDGDARLEVNAGVSHITLAGATAETTAQLHPGAYEIHSQVARDQIDVKPLSDSAIADVRGGARIVKQ